MNEKEVGGEKVRDVYVEDQTVGFFLDTLNMDHEIMRKEEWEQKLIIPACIIIVENKGGKLSLHQSTRVRRKISSSSLQPLSTVPQINNFEIICNEKKRKSKIAICTKKRK